MYNCSTYQSAIAQSELNKMTIKYLLTLATIKHVQLLLKSIGRCTHEQQKLSQVMIS